MQERRDRLEFLVELREELRREWRQYGQQLPAQVRTVDLVQIVLLVEKARDVTPALTQVAGQTQLLRELVHLVVVVRAGGIEDVALTVLAVNPLVVFCRRDRGELGPAHVAARAQGATV